VLVVVIAVSCVPATLVNVVDVITMGDGHMSTALAVNMVMTLMHRVPAGRLAFVVVVVVRAMKMTVVQIVDVITVRDRYMSTAVAMDMVMADMFFVRSNHRFFLPPCRPTMGLMLARRGAPRARSGAGVRHRRRPHRD
jgi:hypothetical protein